MTRTANHFRRKLILGALAPLVIAGALQAVYSVVSQRREAISGLEDKAHGLTNLLVNVAGPSIAVDDPSGVDDGLAYLEHDPDFAFALAIGADGKPIAFRGPSATRAARVADAAITREPALRQRDSTLIASYPVVVKGKAIAELVVGLRTENATAKAAQMTALAAAISVVGIIAAVFVVLALAGRIGRRNREMANLLDNMEQGFLNMSRDGTLASERSAIATQLLGGYRPGQRLWEAIAPHDPVIAAVLEVSWEAVLENALPLELTLDQLPSKLMIRDRVYRIEFKPTLEGDTVGDTLVVLTDKTAELARERAEAAERDLLRMIERMTTDRAGFGEFFAETNRLVDRVAAGAREPAGPSDVFKRDLHTLKGTCATYGLSQISSWCHAVEDGIAGSGAADIGLVDTIAGAWRDLKVKLERVFGGQQQGLANIDKDDLSELHRALEQGASLAVISHIVHSWSLERTRPRLERFAAQARTIAERLGKPDLVVEIDDHGVRLDPVKFRPFWSAFVHAISNAIDHGIEPGAERVAAGKPEHGKLELAIRRDGDKVFVELRDDGRGIDWNKLRARAKEAARPSATRDDLIAAMFSDGISTRTEASETSGRGVGLAALRDACHQLGGTIEVDSEAGAGTRFRFAFGVKGVTTRIPRIDAAFLTGAIPRTVP